MPQALIGPAIIAGGGILGGLLSRDSGGQTVTQTGPAAEAQAELLRSLTPYLLGAYGKLWGTPGTPGTPAVPGSPGMTGILPRTTDEGAGGEGGVPGLGTAGTPAVPGTPGTPGMIDALIKALPGLLVPGAAETGLPGVIGGVGGQVSGGLREVIGRLISGAGAPLDTEGTIGPIRRAFTETVAPEVRRSAMSAGTPGGTGEQDLITRAAGRFGSEASEAVSRAELARRQLGLGALTTAGALIPGAGEAELAGPKAEATLAALVRDLAVRSASSPMDTLLRGISGTPSPFGAPTGTMTTTAPSWGTEVGGGIGSALMLSQLLKNLGLFSGGGGGGGSAIDFGGMSGLVPYGAFPGY